MILQKTGSRVSDPSMSIVMVEDPIKTTATLMTLDGLCPALGEAWIFFYPQGHIDRIKSPSKQTLGNV